MKPSSSDPESNTPRIRSWAPSKAHGISAASPDSNRDPAHPLSNLTPKNPQKSPQQSPPIQNGNPTRSTARPADLRGSQQSSNTTTNNVTDNTSSEYPPPAPSPQAEGQGALVEEAEQPKGPNIAVRFYRTGKEIIFADYFNILLVFVPVGIAVRVAHLGPGIIFGMNAIAIIPLACLLGRATEIAAARMGDTVGAIMNITFGNAVELIIFMYVYLYSDQDKNEREAFHPPRHYQINRVQHHLPIALQKNEIRIVQASLLGSILANLLLILGMCFLLGGLRFLEQLYNSTVTQLSACLLSLSVMSLLLPTAFHASFSSDLQDKATSAVLKVSRGTSVILLLVYVMYLLFQFKSHAHLYESTPQHMIDEESAPGPAAQWMESSDDTDSGSSSDSDSSTGSNTTAKRFRRVIRGGRRRRKSSSSKDTGEDHMHRTPSTATTSATPVLSDVLTEEPQALGQENAVNDAEDEVNEKPKGPSRRGSYNDHGRSRRQRHKDRKARAKARKAKARHHTGDDTIAEGTAVPASLPTEKGLGADAENNEPRCVDFAVDAGDLEQQASSGIPTQKRGFTLRGLSAIRPQLPKTFTQSIFSSADSGTVAVPAEPVGPIPRVRYGIRRTNSLPARLTQQMSQPVRNPSTGLQPTRAFSGAAVANNNATDGHAQQDMSRTTAIFLLLISTGLVAICAEFMVDSISAVVSGNSGLSEVFIGLIILPIVGNAAEHVTAVRVAIKNKMDLAIGVAVGSSIQIALFVTPIVVLLGWAMKREMSLYFSLFETVSLFVSAFIVNFLVLDGRSNYLEGALLCAAYVIIAVAAFFYPSVADQSNLGGNVDASSKMIRSLINL